MSYMLLAQYKLRFILNSQPFITGELGVLVCCLGPFKSGMLPELLPASPCSALLPCTAPFNFALSKLGLCSFIFLLFLQGKHGPRVGYSIIPGRPETDRLGAMPPPHQFMKPLSNSKLGCSSLILTSKCFVQILAQLLTKTNNSYLFINTLEYNKSLRANNE